MPQQIDYAALAAKNGAVLPPPTAQSTPAVDYAALAKQHGAVETTPPRRPTGYESGPIGAGLGAAWDILTKGFFSSNPPEGPPTSIPEGIAALAEGTRQMTNKLGHGMGTALGGQLAGLASYPLSLVAPETANKLYNAGQQLHNSGMQEWTEPFTSIPGGVYHGLTDFAPDVYEGVVNQDPEAMARGTAGFITQAAPTALGLREPVKAAKGSVADATGSIIDRYVPRPPGEIQMMDLMPNAPQGFSSTVNRAMGSLLNQVEREKVDLAKLDVDTLRNLNRRMRVGNAPTSIYNQLNKIWEPVKDFVVKDAAKNAINKAISELPAFIKESPELYKQWVRKINARFGTADLTVAKLNQLRHESIEASIGRDLKTGQVVTIDPVQQLVDRSIANSIRDQLYDFGNRTKMKLGDMARALNNELGDLIEFDDQIYDLQNAAEAQRKTHWLRRAGKEILAPIEGKTAKVRGVSGLISAWKGLDMIDNIIRTAFQDFSKTRGSVVGSGVAPVYNWEPGQKQVEAMGPVRGGGEMPIEQLPGGGLGVAGTMRPDLPPGMVDLAPPRLGKIQGEQVGLESAAPPDLFALRQTGVEPGLPAPGPTPHTPRPFVDLNPVTPVADVAPAGTKFVGKVKVGDRIVYRYQMGDITFDRPTPLKLQP